MPAIRIISKKKKKTHPQSLLVFSAATRRKIKIIYSFSWFLIYNKYKTYYVVDHCHHRTVRTKREWQTLGRRTNTSKNMYLINIEDNYYIITPRPVLAIVIIISYRHSNYNCGTMLLYNYRIINNNFCGFGRYSLMSDLFFTGYTFTTIAECCWDEANKSKWRGGRQGIRVLGLWITMMTLCSVSKRVGYI